MAYIQRNNPFPVTSCGRRRMFMMNNVIAAINTPGDDRTKESPFAKRKKSNEPRKTTKGKGRNFRTVKEGAGMTAKGVAEYRRKNPGSKLKTAVTGKVKPGSKAAKRRKAFCARSKSWTGPRGKAARRRWKC
tara:strand:- start:71 stop:466 length:396 start_codon:yes stop_codon:yes gene_type:complete